jgi:hypothetical protein
MTEEEMPQAEPSAEETMPQADPSTDEQAPMPEMRTEDALRFAIGIFNDLAWIKLGIHANPGGETVTDLPQAQLAIDAIAALVPLSEGRFEANEVRDLKNLLSTLQMNYVQRKTAS